jgi:SAM-dependent methyltransferase
MTGYLHRYGEATAVDFSEPAVALASHFLPDVHFVGGSFEDAAFPAASFDVITLFDLSEHVPKADRPAFLDEAGRLAAAEGLLLLSTPHPHVSEWMVRERTDLMQVVDEPVQLIDLIESLAPKGFTLTRYVTFDIERTGPEREFAVFQHGLRAGRESQADGRVRRRVRLPHGRRHSDRPARRLGAPTGRARPPQGRFADPPGTLGGRCGECESW